MTSSDEPGGVRQLQDNPPWERTGETPHAYPSLDGLRAIAACSVLLTHVAFMTGLTRDPTWGPLVARADVGVAIFFLLSGFLLGRPFLAAVLDGGGGPAIGPYAKRRFLRIYPAYWAAVAVAALGLGLVRVRPWGVARQLLLIHTYTRSTELGPAIRQVGGTTGYPFGPTWTLAVEVSFYVFLPVLSAALVGFTRRRSPRARSIALAGTLLGLGVASLVARATTYSSVSVGSAGLAGSWLLLNLDWFALGMGLAMVSLLADRGRLSAGFVKLLRSRALPGICWTAAVTAYLVVAYGAGLNSTQLVFSAKETMSRQLLYGVIGLSLVLPATLGPARVGVIRRTLGGTPLRQLGLVSYGIYIWQDLVIDQYVRRRHVRYFNAPFWSSLAYVFLGVVAVATVSYFLIERPALALKRRRLLPARSQVPSAR